MAGSGSFQKGKSGQNPRPAPEVIESKSLLSLLSTFSCHMLWHLSAIVMIFYIA